MEEFISRIIDFMKSEYGDFLMIVMCLVFVAFVVMIFNKKTPEWKNQSLFDGICPMAAM